MFIYYGTANIMYSRDIESLTRQLKDSCYCIKFQERVIHEFSPEPLKKDMLHA